MPSSHCPTCTVPHLISLSSNQPYLSLIHCSFHLSCVLHPSCFLFVYFMHFRSKYLIYIIYLISLHFIKYIEFILCFPPYNREWSVIKTSDPLASKVFNNPREFIWSMSLPQQHVYKFSFAANVLTRQLFVNRGYSINSNNSNHSNSGINKYN